MRPIQLTMSAFGPYAGVSVIDMERLTDGGLYLITGDTGAGKTMIFDAIAYALYGEASGTGRQSVMLRSKYAEPGNDTYVELVFRHNGETYTLKRVYGRERINRAGERVEVKSTDASLILPDGRVITRHKDVTKAVEELIGLDSVRFRQTAMLAQGEFRDLLFADTNERLVVLRKLFNTDIYLRFAEKAKQEYNEVSQEYTLKKQEAEHYLSMTECAPDSDYREMLTEVKKNGAYSTETGELFAHVIDEDTAKWEELTEKGDLADRELLRVQALLTKCETDRKNEQRLKKGREMLRELDEKIAALEQKAAAVSAEEERYFAKKEELSRLELRLPEYDNLEAAKKTLSSLKLSLEDKNGRLKALRDKRILVENELEKLNQRLEQTAETDKTRLLDEYAEVQGKKAEADELVVQIRALDRKFQALYAAREQYRLAAEKSDHAAAEYAGMERAYFDGIAGVLAETLTDGEKCPVCGSTVHPSPAVRNVGVPDRGELDRKRAEGNRLSEEAKMLSERAGQLSGAYTAEREAAVSRGKAMFPQGMFPHGEGTLETDTLRQLASERSEELAKTLFGLLEAVKQAEKAEEERKFLLEKQERYTELLKDTMKKAEDAAIETARLEAERDASEAHGAEIAGRLTYSGKADAEQAVLELKKWIQSYETAKTAAENERNTALLTRAKYAAAIEEIEEQLQGSTAAEFDVLTAELAKRTEERKALSQSAAEVSARLERNRAASSAVKQVMTELEVFGKRLSEAKSISDTANGTLSGKEKLTLETFAQIRLFERIIRRAGIRLMKLTDGQYELTRRRESGHQGKSGLDIDVIDHWNGSVRSVKTLSGGEAFKASLALALGLSDETEEECGGVVIDSMFIDEGFGSLDEESLTQAVDMLASLSGDGRSIGIISHVSELRERIDKQLVVKKSGTRGSEVTVKG